jgi:hypothetical protein
MSGTDYIVIMLRVVQQAIVPLDNIYDFPKVDPGNLSDEMSMMEPIYLRKSYLDKSSQMYTYSLVDYVKKLDELFAEYKEQLIKLKFTELTKTTLRILPLLYYGLSKSKTGTLRVNSAYYSQHHLKYKPFISILNEALSLDRPLSLKILILASLLEKFAIAKKLRILCSLETIYGNNHDKFKQLTYHAWSNTVKFKHFKSVKKGGYWCEVPL